MIRIHALVPALPAVLAVLLATPAAAQDRGDPVPHELAVLLLGEGWGPEVTIVAGRAPEGFPAGLVPEGARVLGGLSGPRMGARLVMLALPQPPEAAAAAVAARAKGAGWTHVPQSSSGFVSWSAPYHHQGFCQGDRVMLALTSARPGGGTDVRLSVFTERTNELTPCNPDTPRALSDTTAFGVRPDLVPALYPPEDVEERHPHHTLTGRGLSESGTRYESALTPAQLAAHYAAQLQAAGWTPAPAVADAGTVLQTFRRRDPEGREYHGVLAAIAVGDSRLRDVFFRVLRLPAAAR